MTRSLHRALLGALGLFGLAALAACSLLPAPAVVTLEVLGKRNAPADATWVAVRDARGAWQLTPSSVPGTYGVPTDGEGRFSVADRLRLGPPDRDGAARHGWRDPDADGQVRGRGRGGRMRRGVRRSRP